MIQTSRHLLDLQKMLYVTNIVQSLNHFILLNDKILCFISENYFKSYVTHYVMILKVNYRNCALSKLVPYNIKVVP